MMTELEIAPRVVQRGSQPLGERFPNPAKPVRKDHPFLGNFPDSRSHPESPGDGALLPLTTHPHPNWFPHKSLFQGFIYYFFSGAQDGVHHPVFPWHHAEINQNRVFYRKDFP